ncbi:MAG: hypothetical protein MZV64_18405 [Ignavibacteriales bacterium]|nr:hypothetical protein [Ignavibacteriales bacterium]
MAHEPRTGHKAYFEVEDTSRKAGVLILLYPKDGRLRLLLTRRTERVNHHRGQISLPGGERAPRRIHRGHGPARDGRGAGARPRRGPRPGPADAPLYPPQQLLRLPRRGLDPRPAGLPGLLTEEVAEVIEPPVDHLADPACLGRETRHYADLDHEVPFYAYEGHTRSGAPRPWSWPNSWPSFDPAGRRRYNSPEEVRT